MSTHLAPNTPAPTTPAPTSPAPTSLAPTSPAPTSLAPTGSTIIPSLRYKDAHAAINWLVRVFGFKKQAVYEGPDGIVMHAQLTYRSGMLMLGSASNQGEFARRWVDLDETGGRETVGLCLIVSDDECVEMFERVKAEGVEIVQQLSSPEYGGKAFGCCDLEGHIWWVGSYNPWAEHKGSAAEGAA